MQNRIEKTIINGIMKRVRGEEGDRGKYLRVEVVDVELAAVGVGPSVELLLQEDVFFGAIREEERHFGSLVCLHDMVDDLRRQ